MVHSSHEVVAAVYLEQNMKAGNCEEIQYSIAKSFLVYLHFMVNMLQAKEIGVVGDSSSTNTEI